MEGRAFDTRTPQILDSPLMKQLFAPGAPIGPVMVVVGVMVVAGSGGIYVGDEPSELVVVDQQMSGVNVFGKSVG